VLRGRAVDHSCVESNRVDGVLEDEEEGVLLDLGRFFDLDET